MKYSSSILVSGILLQLFFESAQAKRRVLKESCSPDDFNYEFTDCDAEGGRWRVAIPKSVDCEEITPPVAPKRLTECFTSCEAGQFLNLESLKCEDCAAGTYSLGGGIIFDEWDPLPEGFKNQVEKFQSAFSSIGRQYSSVNCSKWGWRPRRDVIMSQGGPCVATLTYTAQLVKAGKLRFTYQYADDSVLFQFQANSDQCESLRGAEGSRWPPLTGEGIWRTEEIFLHTGLNIFQWKTMGIDSHHPKPIMIKKIEVEGVGYTSSCRPCPSGFYSDQSASKACTPCPANTFSSQKSSTCTECTDRNKFYSDPGSTKCVPRPACTKADYFQIHKPCVNNKTQVIYEWVEPKICLETEEGAVNKPPKGDFVDCPPCNPGTEYRDGSCKPCGVLEYSDGVTPCSQCPRLTQPNTGYHLVQWYSWPESGLHITCISPEDAGCSKSPPWELFGNYTQSGKGHAKWVYLVMTLSVGGFRGLGGIINGELLEVGRVKFEFEMKCAHDCELLFMQGTSTKNATVIQRWIGSQSYQEFSHPIYRNDTYDFSWAFQKLGWDSIDTEGAGSDISFMSPDRSISQDDGNYVRMYRIHVQNSIDGGADSCTPCKDVMYRNRLNDFGSTCAVCNDGEASNSSEEIKESTNSTNSSSSLCTPCPAGHIRVDPYSSDSSSCKPCGPGLVSKNGVQCATDCLVKLGEYVYDLRPLKGFYSVRGSSLFTASGTQYYHVFNISLCTNEYARCYKNVSLQHGVDSQSTSVEALVCQSTIFPPVGISVDSNEPTPMNTDSNGNMSPGPIYSDLMVKPLSTHASSLGDHLVGISHSPSILGLSVSDDLQSHVDHPHQFHFFFSTPERTIACPKGRSTTITFRCRIPSSSWTTRPVEKDYDIKTPDKCPDGTCDGCNFHFIWETPFSCHLCTENELTIVKGECKDGVQEVHYLPSPNSQCLPKINSTWPKTQPCQTHLPLFAEVAIQVAAALTAVLCMLLICFWRRHRKLEYKYMKLMASGTPSRARDTHGDSEDVNHSERDMMPVAESCGLDPNEDEDDDELYDRSEARHPMKEVSFYTDGAIKNLVSRISILDKLKNFTRKTEAGNSLEIMNLTDKDAYS